LFFCFLCFFKRGQWGAPGVVPSPRVRTLHCAKVVGRTCPGIQFPAARAKRVAASVPAQRNFIVYVKL